MGTIFGDLLPHPNKVLMVYSLYQFTLLLSFFLISNHLNGLLRILYLNLYKILHYLFVLLYNLIIMISTEVGRTRILILNLLMGKVSLREVR